MAKAARKAADQGTLDMQKMSKAMASIMWSSDEVAKIMNTVYEIAFQTDILALNTTIGPNFFFGDEQGKKLALDENLADRFPDELGHLLPPKRLPWKAEHYRMGIFDAVALEIAFISLSICLQSNGPY